MQEIQSNCIKLDLKLGMTSDLGAEKLGVEAAQAAQVQTNWIKSSRSFLTRRKFKSQNTNFRLLRDLVDQKQVQNGGKVI